jgi:hypothetical protein
MNDRYVDGFSTRPQAATPAERARGQALVDAVDHCRRAAAAVAAARGGETHGGRAEVLEQAQQSLHHMLAELSALT